MAGTPGGRIARFAYSHVVCSVVAVPIAIYAGAAGACGIRLAEAEVNKRLQKKHKQVCARREGQFLSANAVAPLASAITPVPGGVGPLTVAMLLQNTLRAAQLANSE